MILIDLPKNGELDKDGQVYNDRKNNYCLRDNSSHNKKAEFNNRLKLVVSKQNSLNSLNSLMLHDREILFDDK